MLTIDGSMGEGGGQILRTALGLSLVTAAPFRIVKVRAGRQKPGLMRQHLTAVEAAARVSSATVSGAEIGSQELQFTPSPVRPGDHAFAVGTAGSTTLVLQTVLPALLTAPGPSRLDLSGGTHNPLAPPFDFLDRAFLPLLRRMGARVEARLLRHGFYPAGGGRFTVEIEPVSRLGPFRLLERGEPVRRHATAIVSGLPESIADRELRVVEKKLGWEPASLEKRVIRDGSGPGNVLILEIESRNVTEIVTGFGEKRLSAEGVAEKAVDEVRTYLASGAPVGLHLADQLLVPLAMAGTGVFRTLPLSLHARTNLEIVKRFLPVEFDVRAEESQVTIEVRGRSAPAAPFTRPAPESPRHREA
jgi:RNA 3'-terminal phosphate cyclase (ATP)